MAEASTKQNGTMHPDPTALTTAQMDRLRGEMQREIQHVNDLSATKLASVENVFVKLEKRVDEHHALLMREIDRAEQIRKEALDAAAATTTSALNKTENTLQVSLKDAKSEVQLALAEAEKRVNEKLSETVRNALSLNDEKFDSIAKQFIERDVRAEQAASATKIAVDAALLAQKELVAAQNISNAAALAKSEAGFVKEIDSLKTLLAQNTTTLRDMITGLGSRLDRGEGVGLGTQTAVTERRSDTGSAVGVVGVVLAFLAIVVSVAVMLFSHNK